MASFVAFRAVSSVSWAVFALQTFIILLDGAAPPFAVPAFFIFGDSSSDSGNNNFMQTTVKSNHLPYGRDYPHKISTGRWSDGFITSDYIAQGLGLQAPLPFLHPKATGTSLLRGMNFASAGSGLLDITAGKYCSHVPGTICNVSSFTNQLKWYQDYRIELEKLVGQSRADQIASQGFYVISTGINDYLEDYFANENLRNQYNVSIFQALLIAKQEEYIQTLYQAGAKRIAVTGLPAMGCLPAVLLKSGDGGEPAERCNEELNGLAVAYNEAFQEAVLGLRAKLKGIKLTYIDAFTTIYEAANNPQKFGFSVGDRGCCGDGRIAVALLCNEESIGTCADANEYVFFDGGHITQRMHKIIAERLFLERLPLLL